MLPLSWPNRLKFLLSACKHTITVSQIHALLITTGVSTNADTAGRLTAAYAKNNDVVSARHLFDKSSHRGIDAWNSMIVAYSRRGDHAEVLSLYGIMLMEGMRPDSSIFTVAIKACSSSMDLEAGEKIWRQAVDFGYGCDLFVGSSALNLFAKCGEMGKANVVFDGIVLKDVVCWTSMIMGFVRSGKAMEAVDFYRRMREEEGIEGDKVVMVGLIRASVDLGDFKLGGSVHGYMVRRKMILDDVVVQTSLMDMYAKNGKLETASCMFRKMPSKNAVSWGALISGFAQNGFAQEALELVIEMNGLGFRPDSVALVSALLACSQVGYLKLGKCIHGYIVRKIGFERVLDTGLIDMYAKCGALSHARMLFEQTDSRDLISWNTMITGYGVHGNGKEALSIFLKMRETNLKPDHATFASLLSAFSHSGLVEEGLYWFNIMITECKIQPSEKHYASVVDLLSRAGKIKEAYQLIESMNIEPEHAIWVALMSGCHNYRNIPIGEMAAKKILDSNPDDLGIFTLVSNFFSMARKWDEVAILKKIMKRTGMRKVPGFSSLEVNGEHLAFLKEDDNLRQHQDTMRIMDCLYNEMRAIRQVSDNEFIGGSVDCIVAEGPMGQSYK